MINVLVVFPKLEDAKGIKNILMRNGFEVIGVCTSGAQAMTMIDNVNDGIIVCGYKFKDMTFRQLKEYLPPKFEMLVVTSQEKWEECIDSDILCLSTPLKTYDLMNTLEMITQTILQRRKKLKQKPKLRSSEEKEIIEQAKKILIEKNNMSESEAHRYIQKTSMDTGTDLVETAQMVLSIMLRSS